MRRASTQAAIRHNRVARVLKHIGRDEPLRSQDKRVDLIRAQNTHFAEGIDAAYKTDLGLEHVAHARQHFLMKQHITNLLLCARAEPTPGRFRVKFGSENVRLRLWDSAVARKRSSRVHLRNRNAKSDRLAGISLDDNAHVHSRLQPRLTRTVNMPTAAHQHVRSENAATREMHQQPLPARLHTFNLLPSQRRVLVKPRQQRIVRAKACDRSAHKRATQSPCRPKDRIAFGHGVSIAPRL